MPPQTADPYGIEQVLSNLPSWKAAAFCGACAERLLPNYAAFTRAVAWGDSSELRRLLDNLWEQLASSNTQASALAAMLKKSEALCPQVDRFQYAWTPEALDAALSVYFGYACLLEGDSNNAVHTSRGAFYTVEHYLTMQALFKGKDVPPEICVYPSKLWSDEVAAQLKTIAVIEGITNQNDHELISLRTQCWRNGVSNIGFEWDPPYCVSNNRDASP